MKRNGLWRVCGVCGKEFLYNPQSVYKFKLYADRPSMVCCGYTCYSKEYTLREALREQRKKDHLSKARKKSEKD